VAEAKMLSSDVLLTVLVSKSIRFLIAVRTDD
jgi:hypothetical protein